MVFDHLQNLSELAIVNVETLNRFEDGATVNAAALIEAGIINKELSGLKVFIRPHCLYLACHIIEPLLFRLLFQLLL